MTTPIYGDLIVNATILDTDLDAIKAEGFPKYPADVARFNHTQVPYKNIFRPYADILKAFETDGVLTDESPDWVKEIIANAENDGDQLLVRESHNSRFFYIDVTITTAGP